MPSSLSLLRVLVAIACARQSSLAASELETGRASERQQFVVGEPYFSQCAKVLCACEKRHTSAHAHKHSNNNIDDDDDNNIVVQIDECLSKRS